MKKVCDLVQGGHKELAQAYIEATEAELGVKLTASELKLILSERQSLKYVLFFPSRTQPFRPFHANIRCCHFSRHFSPSQRS